IRQHSAQYSDFAILYRTNAQSRVLEEALRRRNIPYKIYAGHSFYDRAEVKDFLAYLRLISNPKDNEAFKRIINFPARGIGDTTIGKLKELADKLNLSFTDTIKQGDLVQAGIKEATAQKIKQFIATIELFREKMHVTDAYTLALEVDSKFGILNTMKLDTSIEGQGRVENVEELFNSIKEFVEDGEAEYAKMADNEYDVITITLDLYLENVSLLSDLDTNNKEEDFNKVTLMTVHSSKGLEFPYVYIVGCEENLFPSGGIGVAVTEDDIEEERRLFYVAVTRAQKTVKLSYANSRIKWGSHVSNKPSRFLKEIDKEYIKNPLVDFEEEIRTKFDSDSSSQLWGRTPQRRLTSLSSSRTSTPAPGYTQSVSRVQSSVQRASNPNFVADSPNKVQAGQTVEHEKFGIGYVVSVEGDVTNRKAIVEFKVGGRKTLLLKFAKVRIIN
ncbi:MAG: 3'-5' exonuclease, partial [Bacteroidia bacterium]|nr:3'-5' exonuclease [Bacteroidia bacterium]